MKIRVYKFLTILLSLACVLSVSLCMACRKPAQPTPDNNESGEKVIITFKESSLTMRCYESVTIDFSVSGTYNRLVWATSDETIATVDENGVVYGTGVGHAVITATAGETTASCDVTVTPSPYAPDIIVNQNITLERGGEFFYDVTANWNDETLNDVQFAWTYASDAPQDVVTYRTEGNRIIFTGLKEGETELYVSLTVRGVYVNKKVTVKVIEQKGMLIPDSDNIVPYDGTYRVTLGTIEWENTVTEIPLSFMAVQGTDVVENANIEWNLNEVNTDVIQIEQREGIYYARSVGAGNGGSLTGCYSIPDGSPIYVTVAFEVTKPCITLAEKYTLDVSDLLPVTLQTDLAGTIESVRLNGITVGTANGSVITFDRAALPKTAAELGEREIIVSTELVDYILPVEIYSMVIDCKEELDAFGRLAKENGNFDTTGVMDGYFVLADNIEYNDTFASITNTGEMYTIGKALSGNWYDYMSYGFRGIFDGRGYNIIGMTIAGSGNESGGFVCYLNTKGIVRNVSFINATVEENNGFICTMGDGLIENVYICYSRVGVGKEIREGRYTGSFFTFTAVRGTDATVRNCVVDAVGANIRKSDVEWAESYIKLGGEITNIDNLVIICKDSKLTETSGGDISYTDYTLLAADDYIAETFQTDVWQLVNGMPVLSHFEDVVDTDAEIQFEGLPSVLLAGSQYMLKTNVWYSEIIIDSLPAGVTIEDGTLIIAADVPAGTLTIAAKSYLNNSETQVTLAIKPIVTSDIVNAEVLIIEQSEKTELDMSFADSVLGMTATVSCGSSILADSATVNQGKVTVNTSLLPVGEQTLSVLSEKNSIYTKFSLRILLATKIVYNVDDLCALRYTSEQASQAVSVTGYYVLMDDLNCTGVTLNSAINYPADTIWRDTLGFRGTFDGNGKTISNLTVGTHGLFGHIGKDAVIKNITFDNVTYRADYLSALLAGTMVGAQLENITVNIAEWNRYTEMQYAQGVFSARFFQDMILKNVTVNAPGITLYSLFGWNTRNIAMDNVTVKLYSYEILSLDLQTVFDDAWIGKFTLTQGVER